MGRSHMFKVGVYFRLEGGFGECRIYRCLRGGGIFWEGG